MRIFATKSLKFHHPAGATAAEPVTVRARAFSDVPDWVADSNMFKLASREVDTITVVNNKVDELAAESVETTADGNSTLKDLRERAKALGIEGFSKMGKDQLLTEIDAAERAQGKDAGNGSGD